MTPNEKPAPAPTIVKTEIVVIEVPDAWVIPCNVPSRPSNAWGGTVELNMALYSALSKCNAAMKKIKDCFSESRTANLAECAMDKGKSEQKAPK